ncbi:hypothetical protein LXL04_031372 [Taraxacum kok-saghyz]
MPPTINPIFAATIMCTSKVGNKIKVVPYVSYCHLGKFLLFLVFIAARTKGRVKKDKRGVLWRQRLSFKLSSIRKWGYVGRQGSFWNWVLGVNIWAMVGFSASAYGLGNVIREEEKREYDFKLPNYWLAGKMHPGFNNPQGEARVLDSDQPQMGREVYERRKKRGKLKIEIILKDTYGCEDTRYGIGCVVDMYMNHLLDLSEDNICEEDMYLEGDREVEFDINEGPPMNMTWNEVFIITSESSTQEEPYLRMEYNDPLPNYQTIYNEKAPWMT